MEKFEHIKPTYDPEVDEGSIEHEINVLDGNGKMVGGADLMYLSKPIPLYQVSTLWIEPERQGEGLGSALLEKINDFLKQKGKAGVLIDAMFDDSPAKGLYERHGWKYVPGTPSRYVYNLPDDFDIERFLKHEYRYTDHQERGHAFTKREESAIDTDKDDDAEG